jgi:hypothetical protein
VWSRRSPKGSPVLLHTRDAETSDLANEIEFRFRVGKRARMFLQFVSVANNVKREFIDRAFTVSGASVARQTVSPFAVLIVALGIDGDIDTFAVNHGGFPCKA